MAAATSAEFSGTPVGTVSKISWVSVTFDPRIERSAVGRCRAIRLRRDQHNSPQRLGSRALANRRERRRASNAAS
jgi:hypothetical protein